MKKIMMFAALMLAAFTSHAYAIKWGALNIYIPVADNVKVSQSGITASSGTKFDASALTVALYWVSTDGNVYIGDFSTTGNGAISSQTLGDGASSALYTAMIDNQGLSWKPEYFFTATYKTEDGVYTYNGTSQSTIMIGDIGTKNVSSSANFATGGTWNYEANSVPEPTSGLLVLVGIGLMALKRKHV